MQTVGLFVELEPSRARVFRDSIHDALQAEASPEERDLLDYLRGGVRILDIMEATRDVISGDRYVSGGPSLLTDGEWVWREDLHYYLETYHIELDDRFVQHARESGFRVVAPEHDKLVAFARNAAGYVYGMT